MSHWKDFLEPGAAASDYIPWAAVKRRTSLSRTTAWRLQKRGEFPAPYAISPGRVGYREDEVEAWRRSRDLRGGNPRLPPTVAKPPPAPAAAKPASAASPPPTPPAPLPRSIARAAAPLRLTKSSKASRHRTEHAKAIAQQMLFDF